MGEGKRMTLKKLVEAQVSAEKLNDIERRYHRICNCGHAYSVHDEGLCLDCDCRGYWCQDAYIEIPALVAEIRRCHDELNRRDAGRRK